MRESVIQNAVVTIQNQRRAGEDDASIQTYLRGRADFPTEAEIAEAFRRANAPAPVFYQAPAPKIPTWVWVVGGVSLAIFLLD